MTTLICNDCQEQFESHQAERIRQGHGETLLGCPACGSDNVMDYDDWEPSDEQLIGEAWSGGFAKNH